ncbi:MAG: hypothetical protein R3293_01805 [Candidatus Promineifilaceae bacterium]|nr:hypothetical protein [Candidatus Promineifilaceae bacterium]
MVISKFQMVERPIVRSPTEAVNLFMLELAYLAQKHMRVIQIDKRKHALSIANDYIGNLNNTVI